MKQHPFTVGSLFTGIGGFDLGLERAGFTILWQVENDSYCNLVLRKHWPNVTRYGDIRTVDWALVEPVDLVCGGPPCQPVSCAGKRQGQADSRWLWPEFYRCIAVLRPQYVLIENVRGLLSKGMGDVLRDLSSCGYDAEWDCLPASAVGAPHQRDRVWIIAYRQGHVADATQMRCRQEHQDTGRASKGTLAEKERGRFTYSSWWEVEPNVGRVAHGVPAQVDRLRGLGNAIVPQIVEWLGNIIQSDYLKRYSNEVVFPH